MAEPPEYDIIEEIRDRSGPIEDHLAAIATARALPAVSLVVCVVRIDEAGPPLRALLERAAAGERLGADEASLLFSGIHILGGARDPLACAPLLRFLRRPPHEVERLLGDAITATLPKIVAGAFDGDAEALFAAIADGSVEEYVRSALLGAAAFLAWEGRIDRAAMADFLELFFRERLAEDGDFAWYGWQEAVALLGLRELEPLVHEAFDQSRITDDMLDLADFEADLAEAERAPADSGRFEAAHLGHIEDLAVELAWVDWAGEWSDDDEYGSEYVGEYDETFAGEPGWTEPAVNPWRHVGRNDPCPCGSGRKFKRCCLGTERVEAT